MVTLKMRWFFIITLLTVTVLDRVAGRHLFGGSQVLVEIVLIFIAAVLTFYLIYRDQQIFRKPDVAKGKLALMRLVRWREIGRKRTAVKKEHC